MTAFACREEALAKLDSRQHVQVVPFNFPVVHPPEAAIQSAAQVQHHPPGLRRNDVELNGIQLLRPLANQDDSLVGHTEPGEV